MTKVGKIAKMALIVVLLVGIAAYLAIYMLHLSGPDPDSECIGVELILEDGEESQFINQTDVDQILNYAHITPTGRLMKDINTKDIEIFVGKNPYVKEVDCYKSSTGKVIVKVSQRTPVIYILPEGKQGYFLDETGAVIPNTRYERNIIVATGLIDEKYAKKELLDFVKFLLKDELWTDQVEQIHVSRDKKRHRVIELVPRVGDQIIYLGEVRDYEMKLKRLKVFYDKAVGTVGWNKYSRINLEYRNQIICTKHKK